MATCMSPPAFYPVWNTHLGTVFDTINGRKIPKSRFIGEPDFNDYDTDLGSVGYQFEHRFDEVFTVRQNARYSFLSHDEASFYGGGWLDEAAGLLNRNGGSGDTDLSTSAAVSRVRAVLRGLKGREL